ncbi:hypothetical protein GCM10027414_28900 [Humibacter ginsengiterrae]
MAESEGFRQVADARFAVRVCRDHRDEAEACWVGYRLQRSGELLRVLGIQWFAYQGRAARGDICHGE